MLALYFWVRNLFAREEGQDLIEYALIIAVLVIVAVVGLSALGPLISEKWSTIGSFLGGV